MLYYLFQWLDKYDFPGAGMFGYTSFRSLMAIILALLISSIWGDKFINLLKRKQITETQRDASIDPFGVNKVGVPSMGGVIIIFAILCAFIYGCVRRILTAHTNEYMEVSTRQMEYEMNSVYDKAENYLISMAADERVQKLFRESEREKAMDIDYVQKLIIQAQNLEPAIKDIAFVNGNTTYSTIYSREELYELADKTTWNGFAWYGIKKTSMVILGKQENMFVYVMNVVEDGEKLGTLIASVPSAYFSKNIEEMNFFCALGKTNGKISFLFDNPEKEEFLEKIWLDSGKKEENGDWMKNIQISSRDAYLSALYVEKMDCYLIGANTMEQSFSNGNMRTLQGMILGCLILAALYMVGILLLLNQRMVRPLQKFHQLIRDMRSKGQRHLQEPVELSGCLEIQEIEEEFSGMVTGIDALNQKIFENTAHMYELELQKKEAELSYLRGQVDPHFLYNTLEVLRRQAIAKDAPELAQMAIDMGTIFRYSAKGSPVVTLKEEVAITRSYVRIQENRFMGRLKVFFMIPENLQKLEVMKMLLQPLVENAVCHGIEPKKEGGSVFIGARKEGDALLLTVKDDGVGIPEEKLREIREKLEAACQDTSRHVGIFNTQARIRLMYGPEYGIEIESSEGDGTSIFLKVPAKEMEE